MKQRWLYILKILLGLLFIVSAALKIADLDRFEIYIYSYHLFSLNFSFLVARAAIIVEMVLGIGLVSNCFHKLMWWSSMVMLLGYTGLLTYALVLGRTDNCHCFGDYLQFNPWQSIIKNLVLMALFLLVYKVKGRRFKQDVLAWVGITLVCSVIVFLISPPDNYTSNYGQSQNLNRDLFKELLQLPPLDTMNLMKGKKVLGIFSSSCEYCMIPAQKLSLMQQFYGFPERDIVYVFMGNEEDVQPFFEESGSARYRYVIYEDVHRLLSINHGFFPLIVMMQEGEVVHEYGLRDMKEEEIKAFIKNK